MENVNMTRCAGYIMGTLLILSIYSTNAISITGSGNPFKYISSCELDFNNDDEPDIALLVETLRGRELIGLIKTGKGYNAYVLSSVLSSSAASGMYLSCHFGESIKETIAGKGKKDVRIYKTPGTYIKMAHPEGSSVVYFWNGDRFKEVWTSD
jgi:hypothetical protein